MKTPKFILGFELEGFVKHNSRAALTRQLKEINPEIGIDHEGLNDYPEGGTHAWAGVEIRTPPLPWGKSVTLMQTVRLLLCRLDDTFEWATTRGSGLHINVSEASIHKGVESDETYGWKSISVPVKHFYAHLLCVYPEYEALARYDRVYNEYCVPLEKKGKAFTTVVRNLPEYDHYNAVSWRGDSRVEFRCFGGDNYHTRNLALKKSLREIHEACTYAFEKVYEKVKDVEQRRAVAA